MEETVLLGRGRNIVTIPRQLLDTHLDQVPEHSKRRLAFMTAKHHEVRYYVVREMPRIGEPITPDQIARDLGMSKDEVRRILDDLEQNLFFLVRDDNGAVSWAFPITTEATPHQLTFQSGERLFGA
jgi:AraC-like DNA-binding protein